MKKGFVILSLFLLSHSKANSGLGASCLAISADTQPKKITLESCKLKDLDHELPNDIMQKCLLKLMNSSPQNPFVRLPDGTVRGLLEKKSKQIIIHNPDPRVKSQEEQLIFLKKISGHPICAALSKQFGIALCSKYSTGELLLRLFDYNQVKNKSTSVPSGEMLISLSENIEPFYMFFDKETQKLTLLFKNQSNQIKQLIFPLKFDEE